ncbi:PolC-type DNA polymerase III [Clostridium perfringens]|uniref:PolC-type DNA polymerase III n=1 Tax=Clostridium perfringens TaxID=1502 RepID=UPI0008A6D457|nr:PolC-type DNA polymerase III [Clostridium perfringens]AOY54461.1 DNA polymerase III polC-type [Clostridium perfringens]MDK0679102.1 PolC-type DNA polymerase III [Clostridium perfringens]MDK0857539.1 PolC-type DNA polymerase III [Clostridium perfringens]MDM0576684.1 PolC-type DNA polymerase III [Clostridium perfringens]MDM0580103.1 PolC-type DNA polymerase III [Clostridium perfringens]
MSNEFVKQINRSIKSDDNLNDLEFEITKFQLLKKSNTLRTIIKSKDQLSEEQKKIIKQYIKKAIGFEINIEIMYYIDISDITLKQVVDQHWNHVCEKIIEKHPVLKEVLLNSPIVIEGEKIIIKNGSEFLCTFVNKKHIDREIKGYIKSFFGINSLVEVKYDESLANKNYNDEKLNENKEIAKKVIETMKAQAAQEKPVKKESSDNKHKSNSGNKGGYEKKSYKDEPKNENTILGRNIQGDTIDISSIDMGSGIVTISGDVFKTDIFETKTGRIILTFFITDYTSSIAVKCFLRDKDKEHVLENVKKGLYCKVRGEATMDPYAKEVVIMARDINKLTKIERMDTAEEKRVELHMHTTMSSMDAVTAASKIVERAAKFGHKAVAITDHGVVQAFPDAQIAAKKNNIKVIYGVEGYLADNGTPIVINGHEESFDDEYVVFDIETTGFSSKNDKIIEIGAVKLKDGEIVDSFSTFVDPKVNIPYKITELTSITQNMVNGQPTIDEVLPKFMEFVGNSVLVAHNAAFDVGFIKKNLMDMGKTLNNPVMDTVPLARYLYPDLKKVKLNLVAKHLGISLENHHRAVDDAKATAEILKFSFKKMKEEMDIHDVKTLNEKYLSNIDVKKLPLHHIIILAKNQTGIKNLYKLVSMAHLDYFARRPRLPKSIITEYREGLIIGSACEAGQLYKAVLEGKTDGELKEIASFYDYLEIQPIQNNEFLIRKGNVKDEEELRELNRKIYDLGKEMDKPVVATCDCHFLDPNDEVFRRIIMAGQGYGDADNQPPLYFRTTNEMMKEFEYLGEEACREVVIENTQKIADMVEAVKPIPDETFPPKIEGAEEEIRNMTMNKVHSIYGENLPEVVQKRLDKELNSIINNGYAVLYLIAQKLVAKSLEDGYLVGSRGSVGSSFVATMSDITEVNGLPPHYVCPNCKKSEFFLDGSISSGADLPDKNCPDCGTKYIKDGHDIPFETFLGFEGDKEPDIDLNFSGEYQAVVHKYTEVLFGKGYVFKAGTIGTVAEKTAYGFVKKYLQERGLVVSQAEIERLTIGCTGIKRTSGQHPGGIMVVPNDNEIYNFCPIQHPADDVNTDIITTHFDYHSISGRLLKLDILGHDDPTVLRMLQDLTGLDPKTIPLNDPKVISLFTSPDALGVTKEELGCEVGSYGLPEFGTKFVRQMLVDTQPKSFADLVRISGLSHGTDVWLNNAQYFIKEGYTTLKDCIATRDDIMVYLMYKDLPPKTAFTIMEKVRKGKGLSEEDEALMREKNVPDWYIESCKRIKYMFPKGHAVAYVMMAVRIAYYKVYYPEAYYTTYFTVRADDFDADLICKGEEAIKAKMEELNSLGNNISVKEKGLLTILEISYEMYKRGLNFLKVDLYKSEATKFKIEEDGIRPPLNALQGVGDNAAKSIVECRINGEFISKEDLRIRSKVSKTVIETLDNHGCLEGMQESNQLSLFG